MRGDNGRELRIFYTVWSISFFPLVFLLDGAAVARLSSETAAGTVHAKAAACLQFALQLPPALPLFSPSVPSLALPAVLSPNVQVFLAQRRTTTPFALFALD